MKRVYIVTQHEYAEDYRIVATFSNYLSAAALVDEINRTIRHDMDRARVEIHDVYESIGEYRKGK